MTQIEPKIAAPQVVRSIAELRRAIAAWRREGRRIALVPTMGALHEGHLALLRRAAREADRTLVSIFVNPSQFAPNEDLARYPRDEAGDLAKLAGEGCDLVWAPTAADMYPEGFSTRIVPGGAAAGGGAAAWPASWRRPASPRGRACAPSSATLPGPACWPAPSPSGGPGP